MNLSRRPSLFVVDEGTGHYIPTAQYQKLISKQSSSTTGSYSRSWQRLLAQNIQPCRTVSPHDHDHLLASIGADKGSALSKQASLIQEPAPADASQIAAVAKIPSCSLPVTKADPQPKPTQRPTSALSQALQAAAPGPIPTAITTPPPRPTTPMPITPQLKKQPSKPVPVPVPEPRRRVSIQLDDSEQAAPPPPKPRRSNEQGGPAAPRPLTIHRAHLQGLNHTAPHLLITPEHPNTDDINLDEEADNADTTVHYSRLRSRAQTVLERYGDVVARPAPAPVTAARAPSGPMPEVDTIAPTENAFQRAVQAAEQEESGRARRPSMGAKDLTVRGAGLYAQFLQNQQGVNVGEGRNPRARPAFRSEPIKARVMASSFDDIISPIAASPLPSPSPSQRCPLPRGPMRRTSSRNQSFSQLSRHSSASSLSSSCGALDSLSRMSVRPPSETFLAAAASRESIPRLQQDAASAANEEQQQRPLQAAGVMHAAPVYEPRPAPAYTMNSRQPGLRRPSLPSHQPMLQPQPQYPMQRPHWFPVQPAPAATANALPAYVQHILAGGVDALQQQRPQPMGGLSAAWQQQQQQQLRAVAEDPQAAGWQLRAGGGVSANPAPLGIAPVDIHQPCMARMRSVKADAVGVTPPSATLAASSLAAAARSGSYNDLVRETLSRHNSQSWGQHFLGSAESPVFA